MTATEPSTRVTKFRVGAVRVESRYGHLTLRRHPLAISSRNLWCANFVFFGSAAPLGILEPFAFYVCAGMLGAVVSIVTAMAVGSELAAAPWLVVMRRFEVFRTPEREAEGYREAPALGTTEIELDGRSLGESVVDVRIHVRQSSSSSYPSTPRVLYIVCESFVVQVATVLHGLDIDKLRDLLRAALGLPIMGDLDRSEVPPMAQVVWLFLLAFPQIAVVLSVPFYALYLASESRVGGLAERFVLFLFASAVCLGATFGFTMLVGKVLGKSSKRWVEDTFGIRVDAGRGATTRSSRS